MKKISLIAVLIIFIFSAAFVLAEPQGMRGRGRETYLLTSLNLTPEQTEKVRKLREAYQKAKIPLRNQMFNKRMELKLLWMQLKPDPEKIRTKQKEIHDLRWLLKEKHTDYRLAFRNILNQEQLSTYIILEQDRQRHKRKKKK
jgi:Spy/CpxP family protein refolding chaperone